MFASDEVSSAECDIAELAAMDSIPCAGSASTNLHSLRLSCLSDEELQALEGTERENVELRIGVLRNIQLLLDSAVSQMNQYHAVTGQ